MFYTHFEHSETVQKNPGTIIQKKKLNAIDGDKERRIERQQGNSTLTNSKETLHRELEIEKDIMKKNKERYNNDSLEKVVNKENDSLEKVVNKEEKNDSSKKSNSIKEEIDERLKSIEGTMDYTRENSLVELAKKIEILNSPIEKKEMKKDITVLEITELSDNEKTNRHIRNIICHKCKEYGHTKKQWRDIIKLLNKSVNSNLRKM